MGKWIDLEVMPPPIYDTVLIRIETEGGLETDAAYCDEKQEWHTFNDWDIDGIIITHWMPLPYPDLK